MTRAEDLSTKLRVLQYDYERLQSMHRAAQSEAENAEREGNLQKSRLAYVINVYMHTRNANLLNQVQHPKRYRLQRLHISRHPRSFNALDQRYCLYERLTRQS